MNPSTRSDDIEARLARKLQLLRGSIAQLRGVRSGKRFGLGQRVRILHPSGLLAGNDVTIEDYGYLHCLAPNGVTIGNNTSIDRNLWLHCGGARDKAGSGFVEIGDHSYIGCNAVLGAGGGIRVGHHVLIGQCVNFHAEMHIFDDPDSLIQQQGVRYGEIVIEDDVWIGARVTVLAGLTIGRGAVVGAGAVVTKSVAPYTIVAGIPARPIGHRGEAR